jgi:hypothetical protein
MKQKYTSGSAVASFVFKTAPHTEGKNCALLFARKKDGQPERCGFKYTKRNKISHKHHEQILFFSALYICRIA